MEMENTRELVRRCAIMNDDFRMADLLKSGFDPNFEGGWPMRFAARHGSYAVVKTLIQFGANPHILGETGVSPLQLAVYSDLHWETDRWSFLLSCYDSSQLADGAAVAIAFRNIPALNKILLTGRCNTHIATTLTGKTIEQLAKGYKLHQLLTNLSSSLTESTRTNQPACSPNRLQTNNNVERIGWRSPRPSTSSGNTLSPSVAMFFNQTANQSALTPPRSSTVAQGSPYQPYAIQ